MKLPKLSSPILPIIVALIPIFVIAIAALSAQPPVYKDKVSTSPSLPFEGIFLTGLAIASATITPTQAISSVLKLTPSGVLLMNP